MQPVVVSSGIISTASAFRVCIPPDLLCCHALCHAHQIWSQGQLSIWTKPLADGRMAALMFNAGSNATDITLNFAEHLPELHKTWARDMPDTSDCADSTPSCKEWAKNGECDKNPGVACDVGKSWPLSCYIKMILLLFLQQSSVQSSV